MAEHRRLAEVTNLYAYGIILVVLGHSCPSLFVEGDSFVDAAYWVRKLIYGFHMPLFFFVSGFIFTHTRTGEIKYAEFAQKKIRRLLLPYIFLNTLAYPLKVMMSGSAMRPADLSLAEYLKIFTDPPQAVIMNLWFLPTLMVIFMLAPLLKKAAAGRAMIPVSAALLLLFFFNPLREVWFFCIAGAAEHIIYFWLGCLFYHYRDKLRGPWGPASAVAAFAVLSAFNLHERGVPAFDLLRAVCGIWASYHLIVLYTNSNLRVLRPLEAYTYQVFLLSWFPQVLLRVVLYEKLNFNFFVVMILMIIGGLIIPVFLAKIVERYFPRVKVLVGL